MSQSSVEKTAWLPDVIYTGGRFERGLALICDERGRILRLTRGTDGIGRVIRLKNRAMLPGMVNAHSHAFQRVIRGRTEYRTQNTKDSFWTWREMMYAAASRLAPEDVYDASRMAFLEMALSGITSVGEFHYLHHAPDGTPYDDPNLLSKEVMRAAKDVGLRIALLRVAYARAGFRKEPDERQKRFIESEPEIFLRNLERLRSDIGRGVERETARVGVAPHSVRAVPLDYLREVIRHAALWKMPAHMHVAEQPAEVSSCLEEYGRTPVALLDSEGLLGEHFTGVH
ncbi:MAG TPA: amidohydrolase family protein, partial [Pyrinomonadaceae bacterium]|nr:amidohydrolase family protein [Pyrinomonadaceae bacterium]